VSSGCREVEVPLALRAADAGAELPEEDALRLDRHLECCPACRAELARTRELIGLVRLPPADAAESLVFADLPARTLAALQGRDRRRGLARRVVAGFAGMAIAAGLAVALLAPALFRTGAPESRPAGLVSAAGTGAAGWEVPDMDTLWSESAVLDDSSNGARDTTAMTDAVLAAYDAGDGN